MTKTRRPRRALSAARGEVASRGEPALAALASRALESTTGAPDDALTHGFHAYPARMHPAVARAVVGWTPPDAIVLDPFCGSGTVLVEAMVAGRSAVGVDL